MEPPKTLAPAYKRLNRSERRHISIQKGLIRRIVSDPAEQKQRIAALYPKPKEARAENIKPAN